jgi:hypothetical protein
MHEQMPKRDLPGDAVAGIAVVGFENPAGAEHAVGEPEPALLDQREHADRCDRLADARDPKQVRRRDLLSRALVRDAEALDMGELSVPGDGHG